MSPTHWVVADGSSVSVGDRVAVDSLDRDTVGVIEAVHPQTGHPGVRLPKGRDLVYYHPLDILTKATGT